MLKITLVLLILFIVSVIVTKILLGNMTPKEHARHIVEGDYPTRIYVVGFTMIVTFLGTVACGIITIVTW